MGHLVPPATCAARSPCPAAAYMRLKGLLPGARLRCLPLGQRRAIYELHGDEHLIIDLADFVDVHDVGGGDAGQGLGFADDAHAQVAVGLMGRVQELYRDLTIEILIVGGEHHSHAALTEHAQKDVATDAARLPGVGGGAERSGRGGTAYGGRLAGRRGPDFPFGWRHLTDHPDRRCQRTGIDNRGVPRGCLGVAHAKL